MQPRDSSRARSRICSAGTLPMLPFVYVVESLRGVEVHSIVCSQQDSGQGGIKTEKGNAHSRLTTESRRVGKGETKGVTRCVNNKEESG